jgi:hypothetical protein
MLEASFTAYVRAALEIRSRRECWLEIWSDRAMNTDLSGNYLLPRLQLCPACGAEHDCAAGAPGAAPLPGDLSVCLYCGTVLQFIGRPPGIRVLSVHAMAQLAPDVRKRLRFLQTSVWHLLVQKRRQGAEETGPARPPAGPASAD